MFLSREIVLPSGCNMQVKHEKEQGVADTVFSQLGCEDQAADGQADAIVEGDSEQDVASVEQLTAQPAADSTHDGCAEAESPPGEDKFDEEQEPIVQDEK